MDETLPIHARNKRALVAAFGETIKTDNLADLLFAQKLPKYYAVQLAIERAKTTFDFSLLMKRNFLIYFVWRLIICAFLRRQLQAKEQTPSERANSSAKSVFDGRLSFPSIVVWR